MTILELQVVCESAADYDKPVLFLVTPLPPDTEMADKLATTARIDADGVLVIEVAP